MLTSFLQVLFHFFCLNIMGFDLYIFASTRSLILEWKQVVIKVTEVWWGKDGNSLKKKTLLLFSVGTQLLKLKLASRQREQQCSTSISLIHAKIKSGPFCSQCLWAGNCCRSEEDQLSSMQSKDSMWHFLWRGGVNNPNYVFNSIDAS